MLNRYPLWKYITLIAVLFIGILYSLPNLYGEDPAIQISSPKENEIDPAIFDEIKNSLKTENISPKSIQTENKTIVVRLQNADDQLKSKELLSKKLDEKYTVALNLVPATPKWLSILGAEPMKLGLDLRGGVRFLMEVDISTTLEKLQEQAISSLQSIFKDQKINYLSVNKGDKNTIIVNFIDTNERGKAIEYIGKYYADLQILSTQDNALTLVLSPESITRARNEAISQNIVILRNRVNQLGVAEPMIQRQGAERIAVELPGIQDTTLAKEILGTTATLEFRLVNTDAAVDLSPSSGRIRAPLDSEVKYTVSGDPVLLYKRIVLTGDHIVESSAEIDEYGFPYVNISLDSEGGKTMFDFSHKNIGHPMATLFVEFRDNGKKDDNGKTILEKHEEVINIATIQSELSNRFQVTGLSSLTEAKQLSTYLRAGALIAPIQIVEERTVGPSLGKQNIEQGLKSCLWGLGISVIFMLIVYRLFGVFASLALVVNLILIVGAMSLIPGATLTMPGIAGIVLTVGMAIDANVLINERIKEELRNGRGVQHAINEGYAGAWNSIFDANITTLITTAILYLVGVGPIKGFAITLAIGVLTSMFTSIVGTRALANLVYGGKRVEKLSI